MTQTGADAWMGAGGTDAVVAHIRTRLTDSSFKEEPTPRLIRRYLESQLDLKPEALDDDAPKAVIKRLIKVALEQINAEEEDQEGDEEDDVAETKRKPASKSRKVATTSNSGPKSSPLYTLLRRLAQASGINPNKAVSASMALQDKISALKEALIDAGYSDEYACCLLCCFCTHLSALWAVGT